MSAEDRSGQRSCYSQVDQRCLMAPKDSTAFGLIISFREEDAVSKISIGDISDEELGLGFRAIIIVASSFRRTVDDGHLCSHCLLYRSFLSLHGNTDEYQYYSPLGGKWHRTVAKLPEGETVELN